MPVIAKAYQRGVKGAQVAMMTGTAHLPNMEKPDEFNAIAREFLAKIT
jgi:pimeloyl-ACP methyl ester carboxylesterase